ncbi:MAG: NAD(P)/FAD-dependent oxidoreductase [Dongiaceae bacterium]
MTDKTQITDVAIIGAGPVGLFAVFECGMLKMNCHVIDALEQVGGQCVALYPEKPIYDIPAWPTIDALGLIEKLEEQIHPFQPTFHLDQRVEKMTPHGERWLIETSAGTKIDARAVIVAAGVGAFGPNRPPLDGLERFEGKSVFYLVKRREDFRGKRVVIAGGGDSAVDWSLSLPDVCSKVYVVHRRPKFRAAPESVARLDQLVKDGRVELVVPYQLARLEGTEGGALTHVVVATLDGEERAIEADVLLPFFGLAMNIGPIAEWGLDLENRHILVDPATAETNLPGVFAIGDIAHYRNKLKLILCGFSEAAMAAHAIRPLVHPGEAYHFEYSTTSGVPAA